MNEAGSKIYATAAVRYVKLAPYCSVHMIREITAYIEAGENSSDWIIRTELLRIMRNENSY